ncbi:MAG: DUF748 domain-containing protein, partial [Sinobacterium sp.]|nr:DUF748 domain-containing protein [Sinobacterium sp.]
QVEVNPFALSLTLHQLHVKGLSEEAFLGFDYFHVNFQLETIFTGVATFHELLLTKPYFHVNIYDDGLLNFETLIASPEPAEVPAPEETIEDSDPIPALLISTLSIDGADVHFLDESKSTPFSAQIGPFNINLSDFSTQREKNSPYKLKAQSGGGIIGSELEWEGYLSINPLTSSGSLAISDVNLQKGAAYISDLINFDLQEGLLDLKGDYVFDFSGEEPSFDISKAFINVDKLRIGKKGSDKSVLDFPNINIEDINFSSSKESITIKSLAITDGDYSVRLNKKGEINLQHLFVSSQGDEVLADEDEAETTSAFAVQLDHLQLLNNTVRVFDLSPKKPMGIDFSHLNLDLRNINLVDDNLMTLDLTGKLGKGDKKGDVHLKGDVTILPELKANLNINLKQQPLVHFEPYIRESAKVKIASGSASIDANIRVLTKEDGDVDVSFKGDIHLNKVLATADNVRKKLLSIQALSIKSLQFHNAPLSIKAKGLYLDRPEVWLSKNKHGQLNVEQVMQAGPSSNSSTDTSPAPIIRLKTLKFSNAQFYYQDYSVAPLFSLQLNQFTGTIKGISSSKSSRATVNLKGEIDNQAPLAVKGQFNVLSDDLYTDIILSMKNVNLTSFTPYSGTYIGREISKGKLNIDVEYNIDKNQMQAKNVVFVDQLTLGDKVESEEATSLPVGLGVALLKNGQGEIHIDMPIEGDLNDPDFRYGKLVWAAVGNILVKAVASPFKLLAGLANSTADLSYVSFSPAQVELSDEGLAKLKDLEKALEQRPDLNLEIEACYSHSFDSPMIQHKQLYEKVNPENKVLTPKQVRRQLLSLYKLAFNKSPSLPEYSENLEKPAKLQQDIHFLESQLLELEQISQQQVQALGLARRQ